MQLFRGEFSQGGDTRELSARRGTTPSPPVLMYAVWVPEISNRKICFIALKTGKLWKIALLDFQHNILHKPEWVSTQPNPSLVCIPRLKNTSYAYLFRLRMWRLQCRGEAAVDVLEASFSASDDDFDVVVVGDVFMPRCGLMTFWKISWLSWRHSK